MAECQQDNADELVFSLDLGDIFNENIHQIEQTDHNELPDEVLCQFCDNPVENNKENSETVQAVADAPDAQNQQQTNRFKELSKNQVDEIADKTIKQKEENKSSGV